MTFRTTSTFLKCDKYCIVPNSPPLPPSTTSELESGNTGWGGGRGRRVGNDVKFCGAAYNRVDEDMLYSHCVHSLPKQGYSIGTWE